MFWENKFNKFVAPHPCGREGYYVVEHETLLGG